MESTLTLNGQRITILDHGTPVCGKDPSGNAVMLALDADGNLLLNASDLQIGAVELKDSDSAARGNVKAANTARTTATVVLAVQHVDAAGNVLPATPNIGTVTTITALTQWTAGTLVVGAGTNNIGKTAQAQYTGVPSSFAFQTADATVFTLAAGEVGFIQNCDTDALAVKKGALCTTVSLSMILKACAVADDGSGGYTVIKDFVGAVSVAAMTGAARYLAWKQSP